MEQEFRTVHLTEEMIVVEDVEDGHVWTYTFGKAPDGAKVISRRHLRTSNGIKADMVGGRAERYAEREAMKAGKIDRSVSP